MRDRLANVHVHILERLADSSERHGNVAHLLLVAKMST
jgi:hypothetical protein